MMSRLPSFHTCSSNLRVSALFSADTFGLLRTAQPGSGDREHATLEAFTVPSYRPTVLPTSTLLGPVPVVERLWVQCQGPLVPTRPSSSAPANLARSATSTRRR
jgi:hypothetical protein